MGVQVRARLAGAGGHASQGGGSFEQPRMSRVTKSLRRVWRVRVQVPLLSLKELCDYSPSALPGSVVCHAGLPGGLGEVTLCSRTGSA